MALLSPSFGLSPVASPVRSLGLHQLKTEATTGGPGTLDVGQYNPPCFTNGNWFGRGYNLFKSQNSWQCFSS